MTAPNDFDNWLETELDKGFARSTVVSDHGIDGYHKVVGRGHGISPGRPFVRTAALAFAAAALSLGTVGAAAATAVTHSVNPQAWGQQVENAVADCKTALSAGQHGIGECVSAFAKQHGAANGVGHGHGNGKKKSDAVASPGPGNSAQPNASHGHSGQLKPGKSQVPTPSGTPDAQESPTAP
jgi:hypothetical protein